MWPESSSVNAVNLEKKKSATIATAHVSVVIQLLCRSLFCVNKMMMMNSRDIEFFLGDYFFWRALFLDQMSIQQTYHRSGQLQQAFTLRLFPILCRPKL